MEEAKTTPPRTDEDDPGVLSFHANRVRPRHAKACKGDMEPKFTRSGIESDGSERVMP